MKLTLFNVQFHKPSSSSVLVLEKDRLEEQGSYTLLVSKTFFISQFLKQFSYVGVPVEDQLME